LPKLIPTSGRTTAARVFSLRTGSLSPRRQSADVPVQGTRRRSRRRFTLNTGAIATSGTRLDARPENRRRLAGAQNLAEPMSKSHPAGRCGRWGRSPVALIAFKTPYWAPPSCVLLIHAAAWPKGARLFATDHWDAPTLLCRSPSTVSFAPITGSVLGPAWSRFGRSLCRSVKASGRGLLQSKREPNNLTPSGAVARTQTAGKRNGGQQGAR